MPFKVDLDILHSRGRNFALKILLTFLVLDLGFYIVDGITGLNLDKQVQGKENFE